MPLVLAPEIDAISAHSARLPTAHANKPPSARTRPPSPKIDCKRDFATIPIVPNTTAASFNPASMRSRSHTALNGITVTGDLTEPSRFTDFTYCHASVRGNRHQFH